MRKLTDDEARAIAIHGQRNGTFNEDFIDDCSVEFVKQNNFTVAIVKTGKVVYVGATKRMPTDRKNGLLAQRLALLRASENQPLEIK